jgi:tetratricopeptide (TPR) repeat protein
MLSETAADEVGTLKTEMLIERTEGEAQAQLQKLLNRYKGTAMEPSLWFRMAELHVRRAKTERFYEINRESSSIVNLVPKRVNSASSKKFLTKAIETYDLIERRFPSFRDLDMVLYNNAFSRQQIGQNSQSEVIYRRLLNKFPDSALIPDTYLALAEMLYKQKKFETALAEYQKIKRFPEARVYPYGIYKSAWTYYNLKRTPEGLKELESLVRFSNGLDQEDNRMNLRGEALSDMVLFFSEVHPPSFSYSYFKTHAKKEEVGTYIVRLASLYDHHDKHRDLETVLKVFISEEPTSLDRPAAHELLAKNYEKMRNRPLAVEQIEILANLCSKKEFSSCEELTVKTSREYAAKWHNLWNKNKDAKGATTISNAAERSYRVYLKFNKGTPEDLKVRFSFAQLLFQTSSFREASSHYAIVGRESKDKSMTHDASYAAISSLEKAVGDKWSDQDELLFLDLAKVYLTRNEKGKFETDIRFKSSFIAYEKGRYSEAAPSLRLLGWQNPDNDRGRKAQDLYLDILNIQKNFSTLKVDSAELAKLEKDLGRKAKLLNLSEQAHFSYIQGIETSGDLKKASEEYKTFAISHPKSPLADKSWWNSINLKFKTGEMSEGANMALEIGKGFPGSANVEAGLIRAAQAFESMADISGASRAIHSMRGVVKDFEKSWLPLFAKFQWLLGENSKSESLWTEYFKASKTEEQKNLALAGLFELSKNGHRVSSIDLQREIVSRRISPMAEEIQFQEVSSAFESKNWPEAFRKAGDLLNYKTTNENRAYKAKSRLIQALILKREFTDQSVKSKVDKIPVVIGIKTEKLDKALKGLESTIGYGDAATSVQALVAMAECYNHYTTALRNIEITESISKSDLQAIKNELEDVATPLEDKYVETVQMAVKKARELGVRDGTIAKLQLQLDQLNQVKNTRSPSSEAYPQPVFPKARSL